MKLGSVTLLPHQITAVEKFKNVRSVLVGDDTGTGKTVTCIALVQQIWDHGEVGPTLIVTKSFDVWTQHLLLMGVDVSRIHVINKRNRVPFLAEVNSIKANPAQCHYYIVHWEGLRLLPELQGVKWLCIIADEVHRAKNRKSQQTVALKRIKSAFKIGASATPSSNATPDIWSVLNWLYPKKYTSYWNFVKKYIEHENHWKGYTIFGGPKEEMIPEFLAEIEPFYISRSMDDVDGSVLPYRYFSVEVDMSPKQATAYKEIAKMQLAYLGDELLVAATQLEANQRMHQLANAFGHLEIGSRWKTVGEEGERIKVPVQHVILEEPSTKLDALMDLLNGKPFEISMLSGEDFVFDAIPIDEPVVVFSSYRRMVEMACARMDLAGISYVSVTGKSGDLDSVVAEFQSGNVRVFIGSVGIIGESVTLTRSHICIFIDRHWSPKVNKQAEGRIRRIGQTREPWAIDIKTRNTVDYVKLDQVRTKEAWLNAMLGKES